MSPELTAGIPSRKYRGHDLNKDSILRDLLKMRDEKREMLLQNWEEDASEKRQQQKEAIATINNLLSADASPQLNITEIDDVATLADRIASGKLSAQQVTKAYIARYGIFSFFEYI